MDETIIVDELREHRRYEEMSERNLPNYFPETYKDFTDHIFLHDHAGIYVTLRVHSTTVASIRLIEDDDSAGNGLQLYSMSRDLSEFEDVRRFVTSQYLHNPTLNFGCSLLGYNAEVHKCYRLEQREVVPYEPEECNAYIFRSCRLSSVWQPDFEFNPDLKAILEAPDDSASQKYLYIFTEAVIEVDTRKETNWVTPLVYENAWRDIIEQFDGVIVKAFDEYSTELVVEEV